MAHKQIGERKFDSIEEYNEYFSIVDEQLKLFLQQNGTPEKYEETKAGLSDEDRETLYNNYLSQLKEAEALARKNRGEPSEEEDDSYDSYDSDSDMAEPVSGSQLATIPNYNGETSVELFIRQVERSQVQFGWSNHQTAAAIKNKMIGAAGAWLQGEELSLSTMDTWDELKELMIKRFKVGTSQIFLLCLPPE